MIRFKGLFIVLATTMLSVAMMGWIGRLPCRIGFHDYQLIEVVGGFGGSGQVEKVECRCGGCATTRS